MSSVSCAKAILTRNTSIKRRREDIVAIAYQTLQHVMKRVFAIREAKEERKRDEREYDTHDWKKRRKRYAHTNTHTHTPASRFVDGGDTALCESSPPLLLLVPRM